MENVGTNIVVYYMSSYVHYYLKIISYCIFQGQMMCQLKTMVHCKNVNFFTFNYLYLAHNRPK